MTARTFDPAAAADRAAASSDGRGEATDRLQAADDREAAAADRVVAAEDRVISSIDEVSGAYRRDAGTLEMEREMARATRTDQAMVLAFVDVDGLKVREAKPVQLGALNLPPMRGLSEIDPSLPFYTDSK